MQYKGIIFDFNGVMWWDTHLHDIAWREFGRKIRGKPLTDEEMVHRVHGRPNSQTLEYLAGRKLTKKEILRMVEGKESVYRAMCLKLGRDFRLSPGAIQLLDYLKQKKVPITIATASEIINVRFFFKHLHLSQWFNLRKVVYDDYKLPGKPAPDIYLKAAAKLRLKPKDCIVIEDSISGIRSAHAAGIGMIIALGPKKKHEKLRKQSGVKQVIASFREFDRNLVMQ